MKSKIYSIIKNENFWFLVGLMVLMLYAFWRIQAYYQVALKGTKMQVLKTMDSKEFKK